MVPLEEDDDLIDRLLDSIDLPALLEGCLRGRSVPAEEALQRLK